MNIALVRFGVQEWRLSHRCGKRLEVMLMVMLSWKHLDLLRTASSKNVQNLDIGIVSS